MSKQALNFRLISEVAKRRALWDSKMVMAIRKAELPKQWASVAQVMRLQVTNCQKIFKNLRDRYRLEVRKIQQKRISMSAWPYFRSLEFLRHIFDAKGLVPFPPEPTVEVEQRENVEISGLGDFNNDGTDDSVDFEIIDDIFQRKDSGSERVSPQAGSSTANPNPKPNPEVSPNLLTPLFLPPNHPSLPTQPRPPKRTRRTETTSSGDGRNSSGYGSRKRTCRKKTTSSGDGPNSSGYSRRERTCRKKTTSSGRRAPTKKTETPPAVVEDPDLQYLRSLLPHLKTLSNTKKLQFQAETSQLLLKLNEAKEDSGHGAATGELPSPSPTPDYPSHPYDQSYYDSLPLSMIVDVDDIKVENEPLISS